MLSDTSKQIIRNAYKKIGDNLDGFNPRKQQTLLIAEIAKTLAGEYSKDRKIIAIEAGTGTGKSLAYCLGTIPLAMQRKKKVCLSTATVALQEQLVNKDLPFLLAHSGIKFSYVLVKGRQRYVCLQKLNQVASSEQEQSDEDASQQAFWQTKPSTNDIKIVDDLLAAIKNKTWNGDRDSWPNAIPNHVWQHIQSDKHVCLKSLSEHQHCPFHKAREEMDMADVLVINHSLLLSDLSLGGGKILPAPDECFYVIDEAHHLPQITRDHASATVTLKGAIDWLTKLPVCVDKIAKLHKSQQTIAPTLKIADDCQSILTDLHKVLLFLNANEASYFAKEKSFRFEHGILPQTIKHHATDIAELAKKLFNNTNKLYNLLMEAVKDNDVKLYLAEPLLSECGFYLQRLENLQQLWQLYEQTDNAKAAPLARWVELISGKRTDYLLNASPIEVGFTLEDMLWVKCEGAVLCSATIVALNSFDHFRRQVGLSTNDGTQYIRVESPFDYPNNASLHIPKLKYLPTDDKFTDSLSTILPSVINKQEATLVLFSSYWQMEKVADELRKNGMSIMVQGEIARQKLIDDHKQAIDNNKGSILFGTQSFSEGLDLPGKYLTHVIITKLPFAVPTSPVEEAQSEYITAKGGNPFLSITIPDTSKKLIQACGRLLRNEQDQGKITILDRRLITKQYGKTLLASLPPFKQFIE